jgi:hypothetical protein
LLGGVGERHLGDRLLAAKCVADPLQQPCERVERRATAHPVARGLRVFEHALDPVTAEGGMQRVERLT